MTDDVSAKLDAIFNARAEREAEAGRVKRELEVKQDASLQEFLTLKDNLIRPTLEALVNQLSDRGEASEIFEFTDGQMIHAKKQDAAIGIKFLLDTAARYRSSSEYPHLTLSADKSTRRVLFHFSTKGGTSSTDGLVGYDDLTAEVINEKALKLIKAIYS